MIVVTAISLPLANLAFSVDLWMGRDVEQFSWYDVGGLALVVAGFLIYSLWGQKSKSKEIITDKNNNNSCKEEEEIKEQQT